MFTNNLNTSTYNIFASDADGVIVVFSVANVTSFDNADMWFTMIDESCENANVKKILGESVFT